MQWLRSSLLAGLLLPCLLGLGSPAAQTQDLRCAAPPYGDAAWNYAKLKQRYFNIDADELDELLGQLCRAKFEHTGRAHIRALGISDRDLAKESTTALAARILKRKHYAGAGRV